MFQQKHVDRGISQLVNIIEAAQLEIDLDVESTAPPPDISWVHPQLWLHVDTLVSASEWEQVVREATIFFEDWVRTRSKLSNSTTGHALMTAAFEPPGGPLVLAGQQSSEAQGWAQIARGLSMAVRNPAGHRIGTNGRSYAMGALGTITLLMTQVELEHP